MELYTVTVATGSDIFAGTIDTIAISLVGMNGESTKQDLSHLLLPGTVSDYEVETEQDLGKLLSVNLYKETYLFPVQDAWYVKYINVTSPDGKLYQFPVYEWIDGQTSVVFPEGTGTILSIGSNNAIMGQRTEELKKVREIYKWKMMFEGSPYCIDADTPDDLPINEKYSNLKLGSLGFTFILSNIEVGLKGLTSSTDSWRNLDDIRTVFYFNRTDVSDEVSKIWNEDSFFGYQYLNGVNPMQIRKCEKLPENFPVSNSMVAASLGTSTDLTEELKNGNIFLADYKILQGIPANPLINGKKQYIAAPLCLLWKDPKDQLLPIAIQLGQTPGEQTPIFLPSDSEWDWTLAKMWVRNAEFQVHQSVHHLLNTHLIAEVFSMATHRQLPHNHPLYKVIVPHLRYTMYINTIARNELFGPGGIFDQIMVVGNGGTEVLFKKAMEEVTYTDLCLPDDIEARGLGSVPNFFYRDDGKMIWEAIESFVSSIVRYYYRSDESVRTDPELQAWVAEIYEKGFLSNKSSGIPSSLDTVPSLVKYLTMVIFRCSAQHAAVNSGQFDFYGWMPNGPTSMKSPPPTAKGVTTLQSILNTLPDVNTTTTGIVIVWQVSNEPLDQRHLGEYPNVLFTEENPQKYIKDFQEKLVEISRIITERNQTLPFPYPYLNPKVIENSVSI
ncbi:hydroperoxide isomerase ALOXE3-like isoform X2 [Hyla sarda]|nr:hydroperoxide isomerase ALOXE3-like isoform X2 [Hyla sarda]XP_056408607.1 hydroperoxide isomerase ALOXE3-like isoform X2 [Hyla sarda]XP_056408608.1 hydroperoxide isomerase ALOXE3-like isoform X2 [Hyla sarda]